MKSINIKNTILVTLVISIIIALFSYKFPFSYIASSILISLVGYNIYKYKNEHISFKILTIYLVIALIGIIEAFIIKGGLIINNLIISLILLLFYPGIIYFSRKKHNTPIFYETLTIFFTLSSKIYIFSIFILIYILLPNIKQNYEDLFTKINKDSSVLEINCKKGDLLLSLKKKYNCEVMGLDKNKSNVEFAQEEFKLKVFHDDVLKKINKNFNIVINLSIKTIHEFEEQFMHVKRQGLFLIGNSNKNTINHLENQLKIKNTPYLIKGKIKYQEEEIQAHDLKLFEEIGLNKNKKSTKTKYYILIQKEL